DLALWRVANVIDEDAEDEIITAAKVVSKKSLKAAATLSKVFKGESFEETIHIIVERPQDATAVLGQIVWLMRKMVPDIRKRELRHKRRKSSSGTVNKQNTVYLNRLWPVCNGLM
ncbi:hypothetical protein BGX26_011633, partial [Mortierella sp. AD094]